MNPHVKKIFKELKKTRNKDDNIFEQNPRHPSLPSDDYMDQLNNHRKSSQKRGPSRKSGSSHKKAKLELSKPKKISRPSPLNQDKNGRKTRSQKNRFKFDMSFDEIDYGSDDSVFDKDYVPSDNDYDSSDSVNNNQNILDLNKIEKVKKKLFFDNQVDVALKTKSVTKKRKRLENNAETPNKPYADKKQDETQKNPTKNFAKIEKELLANSKQQLGNTCKKRKGKNRSAVTSANSKLPPLLTETVKSPSKNQSKCTEPDIRQLAEKEQKEKPANRDIIEEDDSITVDDLLEPDMRQLAETKQNEKPENRNIIEEDDLITVDDLLEPVRRQLAETKQNEKPETINIIEEDDLITVDDLLADSPNKSFLDEFSYPENDTDVLTAAFQTPPEATADKDISIGSNTSHLQPSQSRPTLEKEITIEDHIEVDQHSQDGLAENTQNKTKPVAESVTKKHPKKIVRKEETWKKNKAKKSRLAGSPYISISKSKKEIPRRQLKEPCSCRMKCNEKISRQDRETCFHHFWKVCKDWDQRRQYVSNHVTKTVKLRTKVNSTFAQDRRKYNYKYSFEIEHKIIPVCKVMFLNTISVGEKFVKLCVEKKMSGGLTEPDRRGRQSPCNKTDEKVVTSVVDHISSYPSYESHYRRETNVRRYLGPELNINIMYKQYVEKMKNEMKSPEEIAKEWLYRDIFNKKFNLAFKLPDQDTCDDCDKFERELKDPQISDEEKEKFKEMKNKHLNESELRYSLKKVDKEASIGKTKTRVLLLDLQKCFPTPCLTNTQSFYLRKLWKLNLTIYDATTKSTHNFMWPENVAGRGGNEIASCILRWAENNLNSSDIEEVTTWTDNCAGQNRNMVVVMAYLWLMNKYQRLKTINHKFLLKGHTHMECDHVHAMIEKKKKKLKTMEIASPRDWIQFVKTCAGKNPFHVHEMKIDDMKDLTILSKSSGPLVQRKKNNSGNEFKISETVWWQFRREASNSLFYKTSFTEESFAEVKLSRNLKKPKGYPEVLPNIRDIEKPISSAKYKDILTLLQWVPREYHYFYKSMSHDASVSEVTED